MSKSPRITGKEVVKILQRKGFNIVRVRGSHHFMRHLDGRTTVVPVHGNDIIGPGLMNKILRDTDISRDNS